MSEENVHFALALRQAGLGYHAFASSKEVERDFGDHYGCSARALLEGLLGEPPQG